MCVENEMFTIQRKLIMWALSTIAPSMHGAVARAKVNVQET